LLFTSLAAQIMAKLEFSARGLSDNDIEDLPVHADDRNPRLVDFSQNHLTSAGLINVLRLCEGASNIRILKLHKNNICDRGAEALAAFLEYHPSVEEIHLSHNSSTARGATDLVRAAGVGRSSGGLAPLWLRLEHNKVQNPTDVIRDLKDGFSVCTRVDHKLCTARHCVRGCDVHLPFFERQEASGGSKSSNHADARSGRDSDGGGSQRKDSSVASGSPPWRNEPKPAPWRQDKQRSSDAERTMKTYEARHAERASKRRRSRCGSRSPESKRRRSRPRPRSPESKRRRSCPRSRSPERPPARGHSRSPPRKVLLSSPKRTSERRRKLDSNGAPIQKRGTPKGSKTRKTSLRSRGGSPAASVASDASACSGGRRCASSSSLVSSDKKTYIGSDEKEMKPQEPEPQEVKQLSWLRDPPSISQRPADDAPLPKKGVVADEAPDRRRGDEAPTDANKNDRSEVESGLRKIVRPSQTRPEPPVEEGPRRTAERSRTRSEPKNTVDKKRAEDPEAGELRGWSPERRQDQAERRAKASALVEAKEEALSDGEAKAKKGRKPETKPARDERKEETKKKPAARSAARNEEPPGARAKASPRKVARPMISALQNVFARALKEVGSKSSAAAKTIVRAADRSSNGKSTRAMSKAASVVEDSEAESACPVSPASPVPELALAVEPPDDRVLEVESPSSSSVGSLNRVLEMHSQDKRAERQKQAQASRRQSQKESRVADANDADDDDQDEEQSQAPSGSSDLPTELVDESEAESVHIDEPEDEFGKTELSDMLKAPPGSLFLPKEVRNIKILIEEPGSKWRLTNRRLRSKAPGIEYRNSKDINDRSQEREKWGSVISAEDEGDGWVRCVNTSTAEFAQSLALALANYEEDDT